MATRDISPSSDLGSADTPGFHVELAADRPMALDSGESIGPFTTAYTTCGTLNSDKSNAILVCHALTGDQYVLEQHPVTGKSGWWELMSDPENRWIQIGISSSASTYWAVAWGQPVPGISTLKPAGRGD